MATKIASGSIDLKSLKVAGEPNKYVTMVDNNGIRVHEAGAVNTNFVQINSYGMQIYKGGTAAENKVAEFGTSIALASNGASVTIGKIAANNYNTIINNQGMTINDNATPIASFTSSGAQIGKDADGVSRITIASTGMDFIRKNSSTNIIMAHIGYEPTVTGETPVYSTSKPYYTFGYRPSYINGNNYPSRFIAALSNITGEESSTNMLVPAGAYSLVEGYNNIAICENSHAEGYCTIAFGYGAHTEGFFTTAYGGSAHAEGYYTTASGDIAHAEGLSTIAIGNCQTVIGTYNIKDTIPSTAIHPSGDKHYGNYAFIIGNGDEDNRSNALTVDWKGNINAAGSIYANNTFDLAYCNIYASGSGTTGILQINAEDTYLKVPLNATSYSKECSLSNNGIKVNKSGLYYIEGSAYFTNGFSANDLLHVAIYVGSTYKLDMVRKAYSTNPYEGIATSGTLIQLNANDIVYLYVKNQDGARGKVGYSYNTKLLLFRIK